MKPLKWSTGMALGEYTGGAATIKPRKYWWGKKDHDPVGNTDDFIWNTDFLPHMECVIANVSWREEHPPDLRLHPLATRITKSKRVHNGFETREHPPLSLTHASPPPSSTAAMASLDLLRGVARLLLWGGHLPMWEPSSLVREAAYPHLHHHACAQPRRWVLAVPVGRHLLLH